MGIRILFKQNTVSSDTTRRKDERALPILPSSGLSPSPLGLDARERGKRANLTFAFFSLFSMLLVYTLSCASTSSSISRTKNAHLVPAVSLFTYLSTKVPIYNSLSLWNARHRLHPPRSSSAALGNGQASPHVSLTFVSSRRGALLATRPDLFVVFVSRFPSNARKTTIIFVGSDIATFLVQAAGGGVSTAKGNPELVVTGTKVSSFRGELDAFRQQGKTDFRSPRFADLLGW